MAAARLPARPRHRRDPARPARGDRGDPRRPRHHRLGRHVRRSARRDSLEIIRHRRGVHRRARPARAVRAASIAGLRAAARGRAPRPGGGAAPAHPRPRLDRPAAGRPLHRQRRRPRLPGPRRAPAARRARARRARTTSCGPRSGRWSSTCRRRAELEDGRRAARASCTRRTARTTRAYYERHATPDSPPMRGADPAIVLVPGDRDVLVRREQADRAGRGRVLRQRDQRHARRRGALDLRADRRGREVPDRVLGARGGQARRGCRSRSRSRRGSRS